MYVNKNPVTDFIVQVTDFIVQVTDFIVVRQQLLNYYKVGN